MKRLRYWWQCWFAPMLCDGCDRVRHGVWSTDGRTLVCWNCCVRTSVLSRVKEDTE